MFIKKNDWLKLNDKIKELESRIEKLEKIKQYDLVFCAKCGCAIRREDAYKAPGVVKTKEVWKRVGFSGYFVELEYIHHDYYCKSHIPKQKKKKL